MFLLVAVLGWRRWNRDRSLFLRWHQRQFHLARHRQYRFRSHFRCHLDERPRWFRFEVNRTRKYRRSVARRSRPHRRGLQHKLLVASLAPDGPVRLAEKKTAPRSEE